MTYLPENPGSEEDTTDHTEEVRVFLTDLAIFCSYQTIIILTISHKLRPGGHMQTVQISLIQPATLKQVTSKVIK